MKTQYKELDYTGKKIMVGIDVHKNSWSVAIACNGHELRPILMDANPSGLVSYLNKNFPNGEYICGYEAGYMGYCLYEQLSSFGIKTKVLHPPDIPVSNKDREFKSDHRDSRKIADTLENEKVRGIYIPSKLYQEYRDFVRQRQELVRDRTRVKNRIKSKLAFFGKKTEYGNSSYWSKKFIKELENIHFETTLGSYSFNAELNRLKYLDEEIKKINKEIIVLSISQEFKEKTELLRSIPGISTLSALIILVEIVDINRFKNLESMVAYFGLLPTEHSSGDTQRNGRMSKRGNKMLKHIIIEISWRAKAIDPELMRCYMEYTKRMKANKAIIKIARKLINRIRFVLRKGEKYRINKSLVA